MAITNTNFVYNPSFIANTTGWSGYVTGIKSGLIATLGSGLTSVTLTTGNTTGMLVGQRLVKNSGFGVFGNSGVAYVASIIDSTNFTVDVAHDTSGSISFSTGATPSLSLDSSNPLYGTGYSARITAVDTSQYVGLLYGGNDYKIPVTAGDTYTFSAYVKVPEGQPTADFSLRAYFYTQFSGGINTFLQSAPQTITSHDGWVRLKFTFDVPTDNTWIYFGAFIFRNKSTAYPVGSYFLVDAVQFETGTEATLFRYDQGQKNKLVDTALSQKYIDHLTGMKLKADIRLGDFIFNRIDEYGVVWVVSDVEGWWNLPTVEAQDLPRGWGDGSYTTYGRYGSRQLTITGSFLIQDTDTQLEAARGRLIEAINLVKKDAWLILDEDTPKALRVRLSGTPSISTVNPRGKTDFSIGLVAANPIKFKWADARDDGYALATANSNAEVITIRNDGNTPVGAVLEIIGPTTGPVSIFNKTSEQLIDVIYKLGDYRKYTVTGAEVLNGDMVFTTNTAHGFISGDAVDVLNVVDTFDVYSVICSVANSLDIVTKVKHNFSVNQRIYLTGISALTGYSAITDGEYYITTVFRGTDDYKLRITKSGLTQSTAAVQYPSAGRFSNWSNLSSISYTSAENIAIVNTATDNGFAIGDQVVISGTSSIYDGTFTVTGKPSSSSFEFNLYESQQIASVTYYQSTVSLATITFSPNIYAQADDYVTIDGVNEDFNGTYKVVSANSTAITFYKTFPEAIASTASTKGTIYVSEASDRASVAYASGKAYYGNIYNGSHAVSYVSTSTPNKFTVNRSTYYPNVSNATITTYDGSSSPISRIYAETLSIDTYTRDVALNGEVGGYRSKLDTVVDWIELQPGDNEIVFEDLNKNYVAYVAFTTSGNVATITTISDHSFVVGSQVKLIGLNTVSGGSNVFSNASTATVASVPDTKSFTFVPTNYSGASNISSTAVTSGYIYEVSPAYLNIYYRSGWIG